MLTAGEPAGVGAELCLMIARGTWAAELVLAGDPRILEDRNNRLDLDIEIREWSPGESATHQPGRLWVAPLQAARIARCGQPDPANARFVLDTLDFAAQQCMAGRFDGLVTGPVQKSTINEAGIDFTGHTEYLARLTGAAQPVMLLTAGTLRVALATTHLPLAEVSAQITPERLSSVLRVLERDLRAYFGLEKPSILVCGLNPHAGEAGHLGREEIDVIGPVIETLQTEGMRLRGPVPADTAFTPASLADVDVVLAMYHDQGLPVVKYADFDTAVNVTLGLPFPRTSVDHGTALALAGTGQADPSSLEAAIRLAIELSGRDHGSG